MTNKFGTLVLKPGREKSIRNRHPWIFSGAISSISECAPGDILRVHASDMQPLGFAYVNRSSDITGRMLCFKDVLNPYDEVRNNIKKAFQARKDLFGDLKGQAVRLIHAEADMLPGLIVDCYGDAVVLQSSTAGIDRLQPIIVEEIIQEFNPKWIYEKSNSPSRAHEKRSHQVGTIFGSPIDSVVISEHGIRHFIPIESGQKTGFFIDQREMRGLVERLSRGRSVLNCFSYTGGFSLAALAGGAHDCTSVDCSEKAIEILNKNLKLNEMPSEKHTSVVADCFEFLRENDLAYDLIILDPPAFAKKRSDVPQALRGYRDINFQVFKKARPGTLLLTASCSYYMDEETFKTAIFQAAQKAERQIQVLSRHIAAFDHPESVYAQETNYLKSYLLRII